MLIRYRKSYEKIAMGLLSLMPNEKDVKKLQLSIKQYETSDNQQLYLWKEEEDVVGLIGVVFETVEQKKRMVIHHLTVNPSFRYQGIGKKMINGIMELFPDAVLAATDSTSPFIGKCNVSFEPQ
ncbi:MAG: GNAT family N-acetyltransferase [Bacillus sp. (in: firmicutes)]